MKYTELEYGDTLYIGNRKYKFLEYSSIEGLLLHSQEGIRKYWTITHLKKLGVIDDQGNLGIFPAKVV